MLSERILQSASTHFSSPQASTSVWNNCRDQEVEFDWMHMFQAVTEQFETFFLANQRQQKQFFLQLEICMRKVCVLKISQSRLQQQQQFKGSRRKFEGRCFWISYKTPSNFTIRIPPQL